VNVFVVVLILLLLFGGVGLYPRAGAYNADWGYAPLGGLVTLVLVVLVLRLLGVI
jgi:hypothetical protein